MVEYRGFRLPPRRRWVGADGLCEFFWHHGWDFRRGHGVGDSVGFVRGEDQAYDCALEGDFVVQIIHCDEEDRS